MQRDLFRKILSLDLESLIRSSQTMVFSLIARLSEGIAVTLALKIGTPPRLIHKGIERPRLSIRL